LRATTSLGIPITQAADGFRRARSNTDRLRSLSYRALNHRRSRRRSHAADLSIVSLPNPPQPFPVPGLPFPPSQVKREPEH
jgi:hypothetical protein